MRAGAQLLANFGGEEGERWRQREASMLGMARLWGLLFGASSRLLGEAGEIPWPDALGRRPPEAIFPWLEDAGGLICWIETQDARDDPRTGGLVQAGPPPECVARVHDKAFAHHTVVQENLLPTCLEDLIAVFSPDELADEDAAVRKMNLTLASWPEWARARFTLKPRFGSSGRGRVAGTAGQADTPEIRGALSRLATRRGALLEPWLDRELDISAQLHVDPARGTLMLGTLEQLVTPAGAYRGHRGWVDSRGRVFSGSDYDEPMREAAALLAAAAASEGYFGPASVDAFSFHPSEDPCEVGGAREIFRSAVEFNARFTLGTVALGLVRRALVDSKEPLGLQPGNRRAFVFAPTAPSGGWQNAAARAGRLARLVPLWCDDEAGEARPALLFAETASDLDATAESLRGD